MTGLRTALYFAVFALAPMALAQTPILSGEAVYQKRCAGCHEKAGDRVPSRAELQKLPAARILKALDFGVMMTIAYPMVRAEREAVATYVGSKTVDAGPAPAAFCSDRTVRVNDASKYSWNGWSAGAGNARYQTADAAGITINQVPKLKLKWAFGFEGDTSAFSQPTVIDGQVFVGSVAGVIYALRANSGCIQWTYTASGPVRTAVVAAPLGKGRHALLFGDLSGWYYAVEAETGKELWKKRIEDHEAARLTGAAAISNGIAYVPVASWEESRALNPDYQCCTFRGSVVALRVRDGSVAWKTWMIPEAPKPNGKTSVGTPRFGPSGAGVWASPTLDLKRKLLYVATGDNYSSPTTSMSDAIVALDLASGKIIWSKQTTPNDAYNSACPVKGMNCVDETGGDFDFGSSAILMKTAQGRELLLAGQKSAVVYALDPDKKGEIVWEQRVGLGGNIGGVQWGMTTDGQNVYAAVSDARYYTTALARKLDPKAGGGLTALRVANGSKAWYVPPVPCGDVPDCSPAQSAALTGIPGVVFSGSVDGHLRAYAAEDGKMVWDFNTNQPYQTVNGVPGHGGAMDGPGPVVVNGMLFVNSGYARYGAAAGNVLLAFETGE